MLPVKEMPPQQQHLNALDHSYTADHHHIHEAQAEKEWWEAVDRGWKRIASLILTLLTLTFLAYSSYRGDLQAGRSPQFPQPSPELPHQQRDSLLPPPFFGPHIAPDPAPMYPGPVYGPPPAPTYGPFLPEPSDSTGRCWSCLLRSRAKAGASSQLLRAPTPRAAPPAELTPSPRLSRGALLSPTPRPSMGTLSSTSPERSQGPGAARVDGMGETRCLNLTGTWELEARHNFDGYLKAMGVGWIKRTVAAQASQLQTIAHSAARLHVMMSDLRGIEHLDMPIGVGWVNNKVSASGPGEATQTMQRRVYLDQGCGALVMEDSRGDGRVRVGTWTVREDRMHVHSEIKDHSSSVEMSVVFKRVTQHR